jgi:uncharacterized cupin superfamily protein
MSLLMENSVAKIGCGDPGDPIEFGALFDGAGWLERTPAHPGNRSKWKASFWIKRTNLTAFTQRIFSAIKGDQDEGFHLGNNAFAIFKYVGGYVSEQSVAEFLDAAGHGHFFIDFNNSRSPTSVIYFCGEQIETTGDIGNYALAINSVIRHRIGQFAYADAAAHKLYAILAEFMFFDCDRPEVEAIEITDVLRQNAYGQWVHKRYTGAYGTNGFHLDFADANDMGRDVSPRNVCLHSEDITQASWLAQRTSKMDVETFEATDTFNPYIYQNLSLEIDDSYLIDIEIDPASNGFCSIYGRDGISGFRQWIDLQNGSFGSVEGSLVISALDVTELSDGWLRCHFEVVVSQGKTLQEFRVELCDANSSVNAQIGNSLRVRKMHVREASRDYGYAQTDGFARGGNDFATVGTVQQVTDTPTKTHFTLDPNVVPSSGTLSKGNSKWTTNYAGYPAKCAAGRALSKHKPSRFKVTLSGSFGPANGATIGLIGKEEINRSVSNDSLTECAIWDSRGVTWHDGVLTTEIPTFTSGDVVVGVYHPVAGTLDFYKNADTIPAVTITGLAVRDWFICAFDQTYQATPIYEFDFGQHSFSHGPTEGIEYVNTAALACPVIIDPSRYVQAPITIGGGAVTSLWNCFTNKTLVLSKRRDAGSQWRLNVVIGGVQYTVAIHIDGTQIFDADGLTFTANGFALGADAEYQGTCEHFVRRASPLAGMDFVIIDNHVSGQVSTIAHNCGGSIHRAWDIPLDGGDIRQFHHRMPAGDYSLVNVDGRGNDPNWFASTANTASIGGTSVAGRHLLILERGVAQFSSFDVYTGNGSVDGPFIPADFSPLLLDVVRGDAVGIPTIRSLRAGEANPVVSELRLDGGEAANTISDKFYLLSNGAKCATNAGETGGPHTNASGGKFYTGMYALTPGKFAKAR